MSNVRPLRPEARTPTSARGELRRELCESGLSHDEAGALRGKAGRQVRRWLNGESVEALQLYLDLKAYNSARAGRKAA